LQVPFWLIKEYDKSAEYRRLIQRGRYICHCRNEYDS